MMERVKILDSRFQTPETKIEGEYIVVRNTKLMLFVI